MNQNIAEAVRQLPLNPLIDPPAVSWWPPAIGWWLLLGLSIVMMLLLWFVGYRRHLQPALRLKRQRKRLRDELQATLAAKHGDTASRINRTLKAYLLSLGHHEARTLTGRGWLEYLVAAGQLQGAEAEALAPLGEASYRPPSRQDDEALANDRAFRQSVLGLSRRFTPRSAAQQERGTLNG